jgi:hypothetical protein
MCQRDCYPLLKLIRMNGKQTDFKTDKKRIVIQVTYFIIISNGFSNGEKIKTEMPLSVEIQREI